MFNLLPYNEVNEQFSNENGDPGILLAKAAFKMHLKNVLVHALLRDPLETLKEKLDIYAKLSGLPIFKLGNDPYVTA